MATWSISVSNIARSVCREKEEWSGVAPEERDLIQVLRARLLVADPETTFGREAQHSDLAFREVPVHLVRGFAGLLERVHLRERGVNARFAHHPVRFPRLAVI